MKYYSTSIDESKLKDVLDLWANISEMDKQIVENIKNEHFINEKSMDRIMKEILKNYSNVSTIRSVLTDFVRKNSLFKGNKIKRSCPNKIGTVMPLERFKNYVVDKCDGKFNSSYTFDKFLLELLTNSLRNTHKNISIKNIDRSVWFTWEEGNCNSDPFSFMTTNLSEEVRIALGLGYETYKKKDFIGFVFATNKEKKLFRPTFADSDLSPYFRPTEIDFDRYGKTFLLNQGKIQLETIEFQITNVDYMPEAIDFAGNFRTGDLLNTRIFETVK